MAILNIIKFDGPNSVLVWKWRSPDNTKREEEIRLGSQLVVNESQEAVFYKGGKALDIFGPGTHSLSSQNLPLISSIIGLAFGGKSPFTAEVYFINKSSVMDVKFGLTPFNMVEPNFRVPIPVTARGSFTIKIQDTRNFIVEIVGTEKDLDSTILKEKFRGIVVNLVKNAIFKIAQEQKLSPVELEGIVYQVSEAVKRIVAQNLERYGLALDLFVIEAIPVIDDDPRVQEVVSQLQSIWAEDMQERMRLKRRAENLNVYATERLYDTSETAAANLGHGGGGDSVLGTIVGLGAAASLGGQMSTIISNSIKPNSAIPINSSTAVLPIPAPIDSVNRNKCPNCSNPITIDLSFCPNCGIRLSAKSDRTNMIICDKCEEASPLGTKFCPKCGDPFILCPSCKKDNPFESMYCIHCGSLMSSKCTNCGEELSQSGSFCANCGTKVK
jgi:membrane protease subunit (stomatin/prohibitin family)